MNGEKKVYIKNNEQWLLTVILIVAAALRFFDFSGWSLSNDELSALNRIQFDSFGEMILMGAKIDGHPAGVQSFLWFWTRLFGSEVWVIRLPFVIFGIMSVYFVYLIGKRWFGVATGLFAAVAMTFLDYPILFSQLARPYSPGLLFSLISIYFWTKIVFDQKRKIIDYVGFALFTAITAYSHHISFLLIIVTALSAFIFYKRLEIKKYVASLVAAGLLYLPHINIFFHQLSLGGVGGAEGWLGEPSPLWILDYFKYSSNDSWITFSVFLLFFIVPFFVRKVKFTKFHLLAAGWFLLIFFITYFYSIWRNPILQYSILIFTFPFLLLFLFSNISQVLNKKMTILLFVFLILGTVQTAFINRFYEQQHFGEFKDVAKHIAGWNQKYGTENLTNTIVANEPFYIHYYLDKINPGIKFVQYDNRGGEDLIELVKIVNEAKTPYFLHAWTKPEVTEIQEIIMTKYPCLVENENYSGFSEVSLYSKNIADSCLQAPEPLFIFKNGFETANIWGGDKNHLDSNIVKTGFYSYRIDPSTEFSPGPGWKLSEINEVGLQSGKISLSAYSEMQLEGLLLVMSIVNSDNESVAWSGSKFQYYLEPGKWGKVFLNFTMPDDISDDDNFKIYVWNPGKNTVYLDDFEIVLF